METDPVVQAAAYYACIGKKKKERGENIPRPASGIFQSSSVKFTRKRGGFCSDSTRFIDTLESLKIRAKFGAADQAVVIYDCTFHVDIPGIPKPFPGVSYLHFHKALIVRIELFHDATHFRGRMEA